MDNACPANTNAESRWSYNQYYIGDKDKDKRRNGCGENHWSGAESLEWYSGKFVRDTMHGDGEYRWRYNGPEGTFITYEGLFYGNRMHGYGVMSYPDGRVFNGLYSNNMRWGPGIESNTNLQESVGLWRGTQLVRITWRPKAPSLSLDFNFGPVSARTVPDAHRTLLATCVENIGEVNSAIELMKQSGAAPIVASEKWAKLYPRHCNDLASQVCLVALFNNEYYKNRIVELNEIETLPERNEEIPRNSSNGESSSGVYYAWNNSDMMINMMKHCFKHENQRRRSGISLRNILSGVRNNFKKAGKHEFDCRNMIMSSYLGYINRVAKLINENNVHPDVADILGNTALMYATCGNRADILHFLVEAGANVNNFNDSCCTPLAVALLRFACASNDISAGGMVQALSPPPQSFSLPLQEKPSEWNITRELPAPGDNGQLSKTASKSKLEVIQKNNKSATAFGVDGSREKRKINTDEVKRKKTNADDIKKRKTSAEDAMKEMNRMPEEKLFDAINAEFLEKVSELFLIPGKPSINTSYLYEVTDMAKVIVASREEHKEKAPHIKGPAAATKDVIKPTQAVIKPSHDKMIKADSEKEELSLSSEERAKIEMLANSMTTIVQLLAYGANPRLVRCPQPALFSAVVSGSSDLVRQLVQYGANINEVYPDALNYTALDVAVSRPPTYANLALVRAVLECGGTADHRLLYNSVDEETLGPTLLHAVLVKYTDDSVEGEICCQLLELLLEYGCSALDQFQGSSATDMAMAKHLKLLDIFVKSPETDLNAIINDSNQTILVKMFSKEFFKNNSMNERLQTLTNLLLYGADPLLECQNEDEKYGNIFVFANKLLNGMDAQKTQIASGAKPDAKVGKKQAVEKIKKEDPKISRVPARTGAEDIADYRQALSLVRDCARILHIRWIQTKLMRELLGVVEKYEHRQWNMILPEHKHKRPCGLWLTMPRCLEIWDIVKAKKKKKCNDRRILKHILSMVHFYCNRSKTSLKWPLTAEEKGSIDTDVVLILREHKITAETATGSRSTKPYVTPELAVGVEGKFQVCFECALPLPEDKMMCNFCKQVSFCTLECMRISIQEQNGGIHPCSQNLMNKYFPTPVESSTQTQD